MDTYSVWRWLIALLVVLAAVGVFVLPIALARKDKVLARLPYLQCILGIWAIGLAAWYLNPNYGAGGASVAMAIALPIGLIVVPVLHILWSVHRIQHIGHARWWALLFFLPLVNVAYLIFLLVYPGRETAPAADA